MTQSEIERLLPHRPPFLYIDRVDELVPGERCLARMRIDPETTFAGHFPGHPILPGVLLIEAVAQTAAVMLAASGAPQAGLGQALLAAVNRFKFMKPVLPGQVVMIETRKLTALGTMAYIEGTAFVDGTAVATGELSVVCA